MPPVLPARSLIVFACALLTCISTETPATHCQAVCTRARRERFPCGPLGWIQCPKYRTEYYACTCELQWTEAGECSALCGGGRVALSALPSNCAGRVATPCPPRHAYTPCNTQPCPDAVADSTTDVTTEGRRFAGPPTTSSDSETGGTEATSSHPEGDPAHTADPMGPALEATTLAVGAEARCDVTTTETDRMLTVPASDSEVTKAEAEPDLGASEESDPIESRPGHGHAEVLCQSQESLGRTFPDPVAYNRYFRCGSQGVVTLTCPERYDAERARCAPFCDPQETGFKSHPGRNCSQFLLCLLGQSLAMACPWGSVFERSSQDCTPGTAPQDCPHPPGRG